MHHKYWLFLLTLLLFTAGGCTKKENVLRSKQASLPPDSTVLTNISFGSCAGQDDSQKHWAAIEKTKPQLFLFIGDNVYGDVSLDDPELPQLREAYATLAANKEYDRFQSQIPILPTWDDHDYGKNDGGGEFKLKQQSEALFIKFFGISDTDPRAERPGLYHSWTFGEEGQRVQIIMLDSRYFRDSFTPTDERGKKGKERYVPSTDGKGSILGETQWTWLAGELQKPAELRLIVSSYQILADDHGFEAWRHLPHERERLMKLIKTNKANGALFLSGDRHIGALYVDEKRDYPVYELTSSSLNKAFAKEPESTGPPMVGKTVVTENFGQILVDWKAETVTLNLLQMDGSTSLSKTIQLSTLRMPSAK